MKKVITIASLSIIAALIIVTIIMACVPVGANPKFGTPDSITIYSSKMMVSSRDYDKGDEAYNTILEKLKKAPSQKALSALFNGTISQDVNVVELSSQENYATITNTDENVVKFKVSYQEDQKLKFEDKDVVYTDMLYILNKDSGRVETTVYLLNEGKAKYVLNYYGNFDGVFEYITSLIDAE